MRKGTQDLMKCMGEGGCFVLCLIELCKTQFGLVGDTIDLIWQGVDRGFIHYNPNKPKDDMCGYVYEIYALIKLWTGKDVKEQRQEISGYEKKCVENHINFWQLPNAMPSVGHFTYGSFDPLENSNTVRNGYLKEIRRYEALGRETK